MSVRWNYAEPEKEEAVERLQTELGVPDRIARLLVLRGIDTFDGARFFFRPDLEEVHDPFLMKDMNRAAERLARAVRGRERIMIYGDYDVDGTTATAILWLFLLDFGLEVSYYIPHRYRDGYGISPEGIALAEQRKADLIVTVDCGITAVEEARIAREKGIDLIVCDHHNPGEILPDAAAVLDPKQSDCPYPFDGLSGAGVGFKLVQGTLQKMGLDPGLANRFLDLVAISIAADIVPITGENRILMRAGLEQINSAPRPGIRALLDHIKMAVGSVTSTGIIFSLGPRINAAGRMGDAGQAVRLLVAGSVEEARKGARALEKMNVERREVDARTLEAAVGMVERRGDLENISTMVLHSPDWHPGVIGIVASRLVDTYCRPVVMLTTVDGKMKGSARSIEGFNLYRALKQCEDLLEQFGGHEYAAGLTLKEGSLALFRNRINEVAAEGIGEAEFIRELTIDCDLDLSEVDLRFWKLLSQFEPFGPGNARPVFASRNIRVVGTPTIVGKGHLRMRIAQNGSGVFDVIGFNMHEYLPMIRKNGGHSLNIAYTLEENHWNGQKKLQLQLQDIQVGDPQRETGLYGFG